MGGTSAGTSPPTGVLDVHQVAVVVGLALDLSLLTSPTQDWQQPRADNSTIVVS